MPGNWFRVSTTKLINAPLKDVFEWCTDFREDDPAKVHKRPDHTRKIIEKTGKKVRLTEEWKEDGRHYKENATIYLYPPDHWRLESTGDRWDSRAEYTLKPEGKKTRITVTLDEVYKSDPKPRPEETAKWLSNFWDTILEAFAEDMRKQK